jgi:methionyl-tRNA synthetase
MLLAAELPPPRAVWAHGYVQWSGAKMSKTAGATVSLSEAIDYHGADALRYFLLREVGFENDGDFTWERFDARYTSELADTLGNLVSRSLTMIANYRGGVVPRDSGNFDTPLETAARGALATYAGAMDANRVQEGAAQLVALAGAANRYVEDTAPYKLAKQPERAAELDSVLANLARTVGRLAVLAQPFLPTTAETVWRTLGSSPSQPLGSVRLRDLDALDLAGRHISKPPILFPKPRLTPA